MFDPTTLFVSFFAALVGYAMFRYGRRQSRPPQLIGGILLMALPGFMPSALWSVVVAVLLGALVFVLIRLGL